MVFNVYFIFKYGFILTVKTRAASTRIQSTVFILSTLLFLKFQEMKNCRKKVSHLTTNLYELSGRLLD